MIVSTIESVVNGLNEPVKFVHGNLYESNLDLDQLGDYETFFVYIPPLENTDDYDGQGAIYTKFPLQFFMMKKLNLPTNDYKSYVVQPTIDAMRELSRQFIHNLNMEDVVNKSGSPDGSNQGITQVRYLSEYAWQDYHLFGVSGQCDVPIYEAKTGCI